MGTCSQVKVCHYTLVHTSLNTEVKHCLFFTILDTRNTGKIALLIVGLDTIDDIRRQILQSRLSITGHKLLTVNQELLHLLTIDLNSTIIAHLGTWQSSYEFLDYRTLRRTESCCIIHKGIGLQSYLRSMGRHCGTLQHNGIGLQ